MKHAYLGIEGQTITQSLAAGDVITALDGQALTSMQQLAAAIALKQPGDKVTLTVTSNGGSARGVMVTLGNRPGG